MDLSSELSLLYSLLPGILANLTGTLTNAYISFAILIDYFKIQTMSTSNKILVALSISNVYFSLILFISTINVFLPQMYEDSYVKGYIYALLMFGICSSTWITTCLCIFYFLKIINFSSRLLLCFKLKIDIIVPWFIFFSEVVSLGFSFLSLLPTVNSPGSSSNTSLLYSVNSTSEELGNATGFMKLTFIVVFVPMLIMIVTTFSTIGSLFLHSKRMENTGTSSSVAPHRNAVCMMALLLLLYTVIFVVLFTFFFKLFHSQSFGYRISYNLIYLFTLVQSVVLIIGNPKLKDAIRIGFCLFSTKASD